MSKATFTPGPWVTDRQGVIIGGPDLCTSIAITNRRFYADRSTFGCGWAELPHIVAMRKEHERNGCLISAAPDLYEVLQAVLDYKIQCGGEPSIEEKKIYDAAAAAIAKADGNTVGQMEVTND
jgi:hypothetical protein